MSLAVSPQTNFDDWGNFFFGCIEPDQNFEIYFGQCLPLVNELFEFHSLQGPLLAYNDVFVGQILPGVINRILDLGKLNPSKLTNVVNFLKKLTPLIPWAVNNSCSVLYSPLVKIFDQKAKFYISNLRIQSQFSPDLKDVFDRFIQNECLTSVCTIFLRNQSIYYIDQIEFIFLLMNNIKNVLNEFTYAPHINESRNLILSHAISKLSYITQSFENAKFKEIDAEGYLRVVKAFNLSYNLIFQETKTELFYIILGTAFKYFFSDVLEHQLFGIKIIECFLDITNYQSENFTMFLEYCSDKKITSEIVKCNFNKELLNRIMRLILILSKNGYLTLVDVQNIWEASQNYPKSEREIMISIIYEVVPCLPDEDVVSFFNNILSNKITDCSIRLVVELLRLRINYKYEISLMQNTIKSVLELGRQPQYYQIVFDALRPYCCSNNGSFKMEIFRQCQAALERVNGERIFLSLLNEFITNMKSRNDFNLPKPFITSLPIIYLQTEHKEEFFQMYINILLQYKMKVSKEIIEAITLKEVTDVEWSFLADVFQKLQQAALEESAIPLLTKYVKEQKIEITVPYITFLYQLCQYIDKDDRIIKNIKTPIKYPTLECLLFDAYKNVSTNKTIEFKVRDMLLNFITRNITASNDQVVNILSDFFKNSSNDVTLFRAITIITDVIKSKEKDESLDNYGYFRNKQASKQNIFTQGNINLVIYLNDTLLQTICVPKNITVYGLLIKIEPWLDSHITQFEVKINAMIARGEQILNDLFVSDGTHVLLKKMVAPPSTIPHQQKTSIIFTNKQFQRQLLDLYVSEHEEKVYEAAWKLLMLLPALPDIHKQVSKPSAFFEILKQQKSKYLICYFLRELVWKIQSQKAADEYLQLGLNQYVLDLLKDIDVSFFCMKEIALILNKYKKLSSESVISLITILSDKKLPLESSEAITKLLYDSHSLITKDHLQIIDKALQTISNTSWIKLRDILYLSNFPEEIFELSFSHLQDNNHYIDIYSHFLSIIDKPFNVKEHLLKLIDLLYQRVDIKYLDPIFLIVAKNPEIYQDNEFLKKLIDLFMSSIFKDKIFDLIMKAPQNCQELITFLDTLSMTQTERWSYDPLNNLRSETNFTGLRNLGATCYMNSILQQLFHIHAFRFLLLKEHFEDESYNYLQLMFQQMILTQRSYCETQQFCATWKGWGEITVNPKEQQDAMEFYQIMMNQLPKSISELFTGEIINTIQSVNSDEQFHKELSEQFYSLSLPIQDLNNMNESLDLFTEKTQFDGYNVSEDGVKMDVIKYQQIKKIPQVLVIHLKRFQYNPHEKKRIKLNDPFDFPEDLDMSKYLTDPNQDALYTLHGTVIHCGEANAGHYTSLIKISNKWYNFNDIEITEMQKSQVNELSNGSTSERSSAYLLFYVLNNAKIEFTDKNNQQQNLSFSDDYPYIDFIPGQIVDQIKQDNISYQYLQTAFSSQLFELMIKMGNATQLQNYFLNVFCHSEYDSYCQRIYDRIVELTQSMEEIIKFLQILSDNFYLVLEIYRTCSHIELTLTLTNLICYAFSKVEPSVSYKLVYQFIESMKQSNSNWRIVPLISQVILNWLKISFNHVQYALAQQWVSTLNQFIYSIYSGERNNIYLTSIDLSNVFDSLGLMLNNQTPKQELEPLIMYYNLILMSHNNKKPYSNLLVECMNLGIITVNDFQQIAQIEIPRFDKLALIISQLAKSQTVEDYLNNIQKLVNPVQFYGNEIIECFIEFAVHDKGNNLFHDFFLRFPSFLYDNIACSDEKIRKLAEELIYKVFDYRPIKDYQILFNTFNSSLQKLVYENSREFFKVYIWLLHKLNYPHDTLPSPDLARFLEYKTPELIAIAAYFEHQSIVAFFEWGFFTKTSFEFLKQFEHFVPSFESMSCQLLTHIIQNKQWKSKFDIIIHHPDWHVLDKFVNALLKHLPNQGMIIAHFLLDLLYDNESFRVIVKFSQYYPALFEYQTVNHVDIIMKDINLIVHKSLCVYDQENLKKIYLAILNFVTKFQITNKPIPSSVTSLDYSEVIIFLMRCNSYMVAKPLITFIIDKCLIQSPERTQEFELMLDLKLGTIFVQGCECNNWYIAMCKDRIIMQRTNETSKFNSINQLVETHNKAIKANYSKEGLKDLFTFYLDLKLEISDAKLNWFIMFAEKIFGSSSLEYESEVIFFKHCFSALANESLSRIVKQECKNLTPDFISVYNIRRLAFLMKVRREITDEVHRSIRITPDEALKELNINLNDEADFRLVFNKC